MKLLRLAAAFLPICSFAACSDDASAVMQSPDGKFRVVQTTEARDEAAARTAMEKALALPGKIDVVFAHGDAMAVAAAAACKAKGRTGIKFVGIGGMPGHGRKHVADGVLDATIERPTAAGPAIDLALLACNGIATPPRTPLGATVFTKANAAAGGTPFPGPGEFVLANLRRQHGDTLTTTPTIDVVFTIGMVRGAESDPWHAARHEELLAAAKRYPQISLTTLPAENDVEKQRAAVRDLIAQNTNAILIAVEKPGLLADACKEAMAKSIKVIVVSGDPSNAPGADACTCWIGADDTRLGEAAGEHIKELLGAGGGAIVELQGAMASRSAQELHSGFSKALALQQKQ